jgi:hypothetical protein
MGSSSLGRHYEGARLKVMDRLKIRPSTSKGSAVVAANDECEFWLLEIERSMSPAGLVVKRVQGDIFARVGYLQ